MSTLDASAAAGLRAGFQRAATASGSALDVEQAPVADALPAHGATLVATSNHPPNGLLPSEHHHRLVLPLIPAIEASCAVAGLDAGGGELAAPGEVVDRRT